MCGYIMTRNEFIKNVKSLATELFFSYKGKDGCVDPESLSSFYLVFDGETTHVNSIEATMNTPFIDGKTLNEIFDDLDYVE